MLKNNKIIIIGAGGHAKVVYSIAKKNNYNIVGFYDDINMNLSSFMGYPVFHSIEELYNYNKDGVEFIVAIGDNFTRMKIVEMIEEHLSCKFISLIDPSAIVFENVKIGEGSVIMPGAIINIDTTIGNHCIINTGAQLDHDCIMNDFSSLAPGSICGGNVCIGKLSAVCLGAKVVERCKIDDCSILGANSLLLEDLGPNCLAYGTPAKVKESGIQKRKYLR